MLRFNVSWASNEWTYCVLFNGRGRASERAANGAMVSERGWEDGASPDGFVHLLI